MINNRILFWNVDTQVDFIEPGEKLYVPGAELLKPLWAKITAIAAERMIRVVNTCDFHRADADEFSSEPDFQVSFPPHCIAGTNGATFIRETQPSAPFIIDWDTCHSPFSKDEKPVKSRNLVIRKDEFDVFIGNPHTDKILGILSPEIVIVYGVTTNVCVDRVVVGLCQRGYAVCVIEDAIKELPSLPLPYTIWKDLGVSMIRYTDIEKII